MDKNVFQSSNPEQTQKVAMYQMAKYHKLGMGRCQKCLHQEVANAKPYRFWEVLWLNANFRTGFQKWKFGKKLGMFDLLNAKK